MIIMSFCVACGHKTEQKIPLGDHKVRRVCTHCGNIHYENPKVICGALALWEDKVVQLNLVMAYGLCPLVTWSCSKPWNKVRREKLVKRQKPKLK